MEKSLSRKAEGELYGMKLELLGQDSQTLFSQLHDKRRIMVYGAGSWGNTVRKTLSEHGYQLDCAIVDQSYREVGGKTWKGIPMTTMEDLCPPYSASSDALIWAIASPNRLRGCMEDERFADAECLLRWDEGFWKDKDYYREHKAEFDKSKDLLCDEHSKNVFDAYIEAQNGDIDKDVKYGTDGTYFNELTRVCREGAFIDCGAYDGQNAIDYFKFMGRRCKVYAFEPDRENYQRMLEVVATQPEFQCINKGVYSVGGTLSFNANGDMSSNIQENGDAEIEVTTIDETVGSEKVAFIKMDVEGAELEALKGAKRTIERDMPILAISAYHREKDLATLIPYIDGLFNDRERYDIYLRHHGVVATELVIYAIPRRINNCG